jgi:hypothetical protein
VRNADTDALRQNELPVLRAYRRCEDADSEEHGPYHEDDAKVAGVSQSSGKGADEEEKKDI